MKQRTEESIRLRCPCCGAALSLEGHDSLTCSACSSIYPIVDGIPKIMAPLVAADVQSFFERIATEHHEGNLSYVQFNSPQLDYQLRILSQAVIRVLRRRVQPGGQLLDVGCGHGALLEGLGPDYGRVGVDFVYEMLPFAKQRGYQAYQGDAMALPFESNQFDAVICAELIQFFADPGALLGELARVCRPGGAVIVSTLFRWSILRALVRAFSPALRASAFPFPIIRRTPDELVKLGERLSLRFLDVAWVYSPTGVINVDKKRSNIGAPFATNFILSFEKI